MSEERWYIRLRGKVMGPFDLAQLESFRKRGMFGAMHEVSTDRQTWSRAAGVLQQLSPPSASASAQSPSQAGPVTSGTDAATSASPPVTAMWHYLRSGQRLGPVSTEVIGQLLKAGQLKPQDMVWRDGIAQWSAISTFPELTPAVGGRIDGAADALAVASFILSLVWLAGVGSFLAIVVGLIALRRMSGQPAGIGRRGLAKTGVALGSLLLVATATGAYFLQDRLLAIINPRSGSAVQFAHGSATGPKAPPGVAIIPTTREGKTVVLPSAPKDASPEQVTQIYRLCVYHISIQGPGKEFKPKPGGFDETPKAIAGVGSGVLLAADSKRMLVATNRHVICPETAGGLLDQSRKAQKEYLEQFVFDKRRVLAKRPDQLNHQAAAVAAVHIDSDLALILLEGEVAEPFAIPIIRRRSLVQGERAVAIGNPLGQEFYTTDGLITSTRGEADMIWTNCAISPGNSGGPLFLSRYGFLAGLNTLGSNVVAQNLNAAIAAEDIVLSLQSPRGEAWHWQPTLKDTVMDLGRLIPVAE